MSESYRQTRNYENLNRCIYPGVGEFGIPELEPVHCDAETWIGFNYAKGCDVEDRPAHSVHFFIDDYQFNRLWTAPDVYLSMLSGFRCVALQPRTFPCTRISPKPSRYTTTTASTG